MIRIISAMLILFAVNASYADLTRKEKAIRLKVETYQIEQINLLKKLVDINSGTHNKAGVVKVGNLLRPYFQKMGFKTNWVRIPKQLHRADTLIAKRKGKNGKHILLIGHLDTVFAKDGQFKQFKIKEHTATGPGVIDDKGGVLVILYALKALAEQNALTDTNITVVLTGDEEDSGKPTSLSRKPLMDAAKGVDVALDFEPAITLETATIARRGISMWTIESHGNQSHSATIFKPGVGDGAVFEMARILNSMRETLKNEKYLSFNPGLMLGGTKLSIEKSNDQGSAFGKENVVSKTAMTKGDFRYLDEKQREDFKIKLTDMTKLSLAGTQSTVSFQDGIPAMQPSRQNYLLLEAYSQVSKDLEQGEVKALDAGLRGAGDISYVAGIVPQNLAGLGPTGFATHAVGERIDLDSLPIQTKRAALLIYRLTR